MDTTGAVRRNRSWPEALKREIVAASFVAGSSVSLVARRYDVNANQVFKWRKLFGDGGPLMGSPASVGPRLLPVMVTDDRGDDVPPVSSAMDPIEIDVLGTYRVRVGRGVDSHALRMVLDVLERR